MVQVIVNQAAMHELVSSPQSPLVVQFVGIAKRVQTEADILAPSLQHANLKRNLLENGVEGKILYAFVLNRTYYAKWVHQGTGIYGPTGKRIVPTHAPNLVFYWHKAGKQMSVPSVAGQRGQEWLVRALKRVVGAQNVVVRHPSTSGYLPW